MNRVRISPLVLASVLAITASAQAAAPSAGTEAIIVATPAVATAHALSDAKAGIDRHCLQHTGSRIVARNGRGKGGKRCIAANGRVYSRDDIDRTGEIDIADALRKLDPSIH